MPPDEAVVRVQHWAGAEVHPTLQGAGHQDVGVAVHGDAGAEADVGADRGLGPEGSADRVVFGDKEIRSRVVGKPEVVEAGDEPAKAGEVNVARGIERQGVGLVGVAVAGLFGPKDRALRIVLGEEDVLGTERW